MSLDHAILGFLTYRPMSGYELKGMFDLSVRHFWPADQSQIYRTLARLAERGWADVEVVEQETRPDRKVYRITDGGRAELHEWLVTPLEPSPLRLARLVQVFFASQLTDDEVLAVLERMANQWRMELERLRGVNEWGRGCEEWKSASRRERFFAGLTLEYGLRAMRCSLEWLEDAMERIRRGDHVRGAEQ